ncbi:MAG: cadherin-like beta sandwich domain-containing protein, partial [Bacteroidetes bacterium]|nr:cadherin-like beta sandwich domain-containing protein [Bacteroidota bacterium]MCL2303251.1 cadherin-like beta sandwich domain-containing protein [Lentimicrobiaceae bacterium]
MKKNLQKNSLLFNHKEHKEITKNTIFNLKSENCKLLTLFCLLLFCFLLPQKVQAQIIYRAGTSTQPHQIPNATAMNQFRDLVANGNRTYINENIYWELTANISYSGGRIGAGGSNDYFTGHFNGNGHTITSNAISHTSWDYVGFFSWTRNAHFKNFTLSIPYVDGRNYVGGLIGEVHRNLTIDNVHVRLTSSTDWYGQFCGGMIGNTWDIAGYSVNISNSSVVTGTVRLHRGSGHYDAGGLIGGVRHSTNSNPASATINITDVLVDVTFSPQSDRNVIGGVIGWIEHNKTVNFTRVVAVSVIPSAGSYQRGRIIGSMGNNTKANFSAVFASNTATIGNMYPSATTSGTVTSMHSWTGNHWTDNSRVYDLLERRNNLNGVIAAGTRGNEKWGYDIAGRPQISTTAYAVRVARGTGVSSISGVRFVDGTNNYVNANQILTVIPTTTPNGNQRINYTFTPAYNHSSGAANNFSAEMSGNNWRLTARVNGTVTSSIINIPHPLIPGVDFDQWTRNVTLDWNYNNPQNLTGRFYVYRREAAPASGAWALIAPTGGTSVENGSSRSMNVTNAIATADFNKTFEYCIAFVEGTGSAPASPNDINVNNRITVSVNTTPTMGTWTVTATPADNNIAVSFTADNRLTNSADYSYSIERSVNGGAYTNWLTNQNFSGATSYSHTDNMPTSPCDAYKYRVGISAFNTAFQRESEEARITGNTKFTVAEPFKATKGEYANYVRLQWKVDRISGGSPETFRVFRRVANTNDQFIELETVTSNSATVYWNDNNALTGVYYEYRVTLYQVCSGNETPLETKTDIGFTQAFGVVSGRVTYGTGNAVQGVNTLVRRNDLQQGESQYHSLKSTGGGQKFEWLADQTYFNNIWTSKNWTLQFWVNPESSNTGTNIMGYIGGNAISMTAVSGGYQIYTAMGTAYRSEIIPAHHFSHIVITRSGDNVKIYTVCDQNRDSIYIKNTSFTYTTATNQMAADCKISFGHNFRGNIDDVRFWNRSLSEAEITRDYSRRLAGNESGLRGYWTFDENLTDYAFDMSRVGTVYNGNHATTNTLVFDNKIPDEKYQLALKGITDADGNYQISGIPYVGEGTSYSIVPSLGVHQFNPTQQLRYISPNSMVHNATDFTDISSFTVSGYVVYEGGNYPVVGCSFEIDDQVVTRPNGELVKTDNDGFFTISVPIGIHKVRVVKQGHTFAADGYLKKLVIDPTSGEEYYVDLNYNAPVNNVYFYDQTRVKLIGRVVGGLTENDKPLGFGESVNNIGMHTLTLETTRLPYNFTNTPFSETFNHNEGQWRKPGGIADDQTSVTYNQKNITISVSPETGEFVAHIYPEPYNIREIRVPGAGGVQLTVYNNNEMIDLTNAVTTNPEYMRTSVRIWTDSTFVSGKPGVLDHWQYFELSDTVRYHYDWKYYYQSTPTFSVEQLVNGEPVDFFGEESFILSDAFTGETDTLSLYHNGNYLFEKPVFRQGMPYVFFMSAYEEYTNYISDPAEIVRYPVKEGKVNMSNNIKLNPSPETIDMDENGKAAYIFMAGAPNLTTGSNDFFATLSLGAISYYWDMGLEPVDVWHLGEKSTGNDFMTAGPDKVDIILRDPPGSRSKAFIERGTTIVSKNTTNIQNSVEVAATLNFLFGMKQTTFAGLGGGVINEFELIHDLTLGMHTEEKWTTNTVNTTTTTFTERVETSDDPIYVGHYGDVFIGNSTNILYGLTNGINIVKISDLEDDDEPLYVGTNYSIAPTLSFSFGQTFDTRFVFTTVDIEEIMIPKWRSGLENLLKPMGTQVNTAFISNPVYVSKLPRSHENWGKINMDPVFGNLASPPDSPDDGPSYKVFFPNDYDMELFDMDSVMYFNNQINLWIATLTQNEREKVQMARKGNYSFGSGASITYTETTETDKTTITGFSFMLNPSIATKHGFQVCKVGLTIEGKADYKYEKETIEEDSKISTIITGFTLQEEGDDDQLTVDYGTTASGTFAFKTRGGRTSCPYEGLLVTQYFEPGQHILSEATLQIEVPKIRVASAPMVLNVPANKEATFLLALENESETNEDVYFMLKVDEFTNPHGAVLKIDGLGIGNGRVFLVKAGQTLYKTLTVGKGTADRYENIGLILMSMCQYDPTVEHIEDIYDKTYISVEFIPAVSDVAIAEPTQNWILNADNQTGDTLYVTLNNYDVNFPNFGLIKLEYRPISSPNWSTIMTFYPSLLYPKAQGAKENIGTRPQIVYPWKMPKEDGAYELRATTASVNIASDSTIIGNPLSTFITDAVAGYKDVTRPSALGAPSPASGILGIGDELSITFNEDIQTGMLIKDNFSITGILNAQEIAEPNVGIAFAGVHSAQTELPIFTNGSFSIETWFMRTPGTAGTLFAFGSNNNNISLGFNTAGNAILKIGNETYTSVIAIANDETWKYIAMAYNREDNTVSVYKFEGSNTDNTLFTNRALTAIPETQGKLIVGNDFSFLNGFNGAMAQLHIYGISREEADIAADKSLSKSGREHGLIGYWLMDEAEGNIAKDKARARHLTLNTDWYIYPSGYAKQTNNNYFSINTANYSLNAFCDFTLEFWFRSTGTSQPNQTLLSCDNGYIATNATGGLTLFKNDGTVIRTLTTNNLTDTKWHHVALSVKRNGNANVYIDGMNVATFAETLLGTFSSGFYYFGAKRTPPNTFDNYFTGYFDEIRIWNSALTRESIMLNKNSKLRGDEHGLQAYYPFENYIKQSNGLITVIPTNENNAETDDFTAAGTVTGFSTIAVPVKDVRHVENVPFTYVASSNKIVFTLDNSYFARVEGTTLTITVKDVYDMRNNKSNTEQWTAYVKRNPLLWDADPIYIQMQKGETKTFTARIVNSGGATVSYSIENLPAWLTVNNSVGNLQPLASRELTFSIPAGVNIGNYETALRLTCGNGVMEILPVQLKVTGQRPDWEVNPNDFENSMNIIGQIQIEGVFQEDPDDLLGAFIGNLCVGVASPIYFDAINAYFVFADIYGNSVHNNQPITFKLWDASTGRIYPQVETSVPDIRFVPNQIIGKSSNPVIFNALDASEQIISLRTGWTWVSANVLSNDPSILNQMKASLSTAGILIKGHNGFIQQPGWIGNLTEISETQMYQINSNRDHALVLSGVSAKPAETPITINNAWNWIGYIPSLNLPVSSALAGIDAQTDDQIKGQNGFAVYMEPLGWIGSLQTMQSGQGYMYYSNNPVEYDFYYPSTGGRGGSPALPDGDYENDEDSYDLMVLRSSGLTPVWTPNTSGYSGTMTMMAVVFDAAANANLSSDMIEIGAFSNGECRGSVFLQYISALDQYLGFLMIYGEGNETITLKVYDHDTAMEYDANNEPIVFVANGMFGEPANPYIISLGTAALSDVATLSNLTVSEGLLTPTFNSNVYNYTANVPYNVTSLILTGIATDVNATVTGNGTKTINVGANVFTITVTAADGVTELEYTVTVNRALNTVATLSNLTVSTGTLSPVFSSTQYIYTVDVPYSVTSLTLAAVATDINATVAGDGVKTLTTGFNLAVITVTAEDGVTTLTYMVLINRAYNNVATLSNLTVSEGTLTPAFSSTVYNYSVTV